MQGEEKTAHMKPSPPIFAQKQHSLFPYRLKFRPCRADFLRDADLDLYPNKYPPHSRVITLPRFRQVHSLKQLDFIYRFICRLLMLLFWFSYIRAAHFSVRIQFHQLPRGDEFSSFIPVTSGSKTPAPRCPYYIRACFCRRRRKTNDDKFWIRRFYDRISWVKFAPNEFSFQRPLSAPLRQRHALCARNSASRAL